MGADHREKGFHEKIMSDVGLEILSLSMTTNPVLYRIMATILSVAGSESCCTTRLSPFILSFSGGILHMGRKNHVNKQVVIIGMQDNDGIIYRTIEVYNDLIKEY